MKKKILLLLFLFLNIGLLSQAQNVRIEGVGEGIGGKTIRFITIEDNLSNLEVERGRYDVGKTDSIFSFKTTLSHASPMTIRIEMYDYHFIAEPGMTYKMRILPFNYNMDDSSNVIIFKVPLPIVIENLTEDNINSKIFEFDSVLDDFIYEFDRDLLILRNKEVIDSLKTLEYYFTKDIDSSNYFANYVKYSIASVLYSTNIFNKDNLRKKLFFNKPILYNNIGYMNCFEMVYGNYFTDGNKIFSERTLENWFAGNNYHALIDSLGIDTLLINEVFRELVFLRGMKEAFFSLKFDQTEVFKMLERFTYETKFPEHKEIANNLLSLFLKNSYSGLKPKTFTLKTIEGKDISLSDFSDKPLVISFVKVNQIPSRKELEAQFGFEDKISQGCDFLTVSCDRSLDALYNFQKNSKIGSRYKWKFVYLDNNWDLLELFNIKEFPTFILIDKGTILQNPMPNPSEGGLLRFLPQR